MSATQLNPDAWHCDPLAHLSRIRGLVAAGGPRLEQYGQVQDWLEQTDRLLTEGLLDKEGVLQIWRELGDEFLSDTMQGFALRKPYGYAGDFEIIDRIYREHVSTNPRLRRWDLFFHAQRTPRAVRNRKAFFHSMLADTVERRGRAAATIEVLNLGSGPCRDVAEFLAAQPTVPMSMDCVDQDYRAIDYAKSLIAPVRAVGEVRFIQSNVVRFRPSRVYDLIWSAGLFDYLPDRLFTSLLSRMLRHIQTGGRAVVGNFRPGHSTRHYMELAGDWVLIYRTPEQLIQLCARFRRQGGANRGETGA